MGVELPATARLRNMKIAKHTLNNTGASALFYADDIVLLSQTHEKHKELSEKCEEYASNHGFLFNVNKSITFSETPLMLHNGIIPRERIFKYLGFLFQQTGSAETEHNAKNNQKAGLRFQRLCRLGIRFGNIGIQNVFFLKSQMEHLH